MEMRIIRVFGRKTQRQLGIESEISQTRVHEIENSYYVPSEEEKARLAAALNVSVDDIDWPKR
jgi:transcriptional regulator with XRE-family HTH domain